MNYSEQLAEIESQIHQQREFIKPYEDEIEKLNRLAHDVRSKMWEDKHCVKFGERVYVNGKETLLDSFDGHWAKARKIRKDGHPANNTFTIFSIDKIEPILNSNQP